MWIAAKSSSTRRATLGELIIPIKLHKDVTAHLKVVIEKEATE